MDLRRLIPIARAWLPALTLGAILGAAAGFAVSTLQPNVYEAKTILIVGQSLSAANPDYNQLLVSQQLSTTYATVARTRPILAAAARQLHLTETPDDLAARVRADAPVDSTLLTITVQDGDPGRASALANAIADQLIAASPSLQGRQQAFQQSISEELAATEDQIATAQAQVEALTSKTGRTAKDDAQLETLSARLTSLRSTYATLLGLSNSAANLLSVVEPAVAAPQPVSPKPLLNALLGAVIGLLIVAGFAFVVEYLDDSIKDPETVREVAGLSTLGLIARMKGEKGRSEIYRLTTLLYPRSVVTEAYRTLRTNVELASIDAPVRTLLVTSALPGDGKTVTAANLAVVFAQADRRVLLVDADLRKPGVYEMFNLPNIGGLTTRLRDDKIELATLLNGTEEPNLRVLTTGPLPPNPAELLGSKRMRQVIDELAAAADLVVIDSAPLNGVTDSVILSTLVDGTVVVIDASRGRRRAVRDGRDALARAGANVLGAVLNRLPARTETGYGYAEPYTDREGARKVAEPQPSVAEASVATSRR